jgi:hypothetical protein
MCWGTISHFASTLLTPRMCRTLITVPSPCLLPCLCHVFAMSLPCSCPVFAMSSLPCFCPVFAMLLPCLRCPCHVFAMSLPMATTTRHTHGNDKAPTCQIQGNSMAHHHIKSRAKTLQQHDNALHIHYTRMANAGHHHGNVQDTATPAWNIHGKLFSAMHLNCVCHAFAMSLPCLCHATVYWPC